MKKDDCESMNEIVEIEYVENQGMQPFTTTCPKCKASIYGDPPQITFNCPRCGVNLVRKGFKVQDLFWKNK